MRIYIAGPCTGLPLMNYPAFHAEAARLRDMGFVVENPAEGPELPTWEAYMRRALRQMLTCDLVALLPGWEASRGATIERQTALACGLAVCLASDLADGAGLA